MNLLPLLLLVLHGTSPSELAREAVSLMLEGDYAGASEILEELHTRMPHNGGITYNLAATLFADGRFDDADSLLAGIKEEDVNADTLRAASILNRLALAIENEDYGGVEKTVQELEDIIGKGKSLPSEITALEAGLNWLENHEPPEDESNQDEEEGGGGGEGEEEKEEDKSGEEQQNENEAGGQQEDQESRDESGADNGNRQDDEETRQSQSPQPPPPPRVGELTPEQARAILDLVGEETPLPSDSTQGWSGGYQSGPPW